MASEDDNCHFDAYASVRRDSQKKMIIVFGNDECIFKDNAYSSMTWIGPNGEKPMMPKYEFPGIMISAFQSREFGFGFHELTDDNSKRVNDYRDLQQNKYYNDWIDSDEIFPSNSSDESKSKF